MEADLRSTRQTIDSAAAREASFKAQLEEQVRLLVLGEYETLFLLFTLYYLCLMGYGLDLFHLFSLTSVPAPMTPRTNMNANCAITPNQ